MILTEKKPVTIHILNEILASNAGSFDYQPDLVHNQLSGEKL